ncbi:MAG: hypothetical protein QOF21_824 [Actinomycetota bacterium]
MELTIRRAEAVDVPIVLRLWREADAEPSHTDDAASLIQLIDKDPAALLLAVDGDAVVGSIIAGWDGWRGGIYRLAVAPSHRRQGIGRQLLSAAEQRLEEAGALRSAAIVVETEAQAIGFWNRSGWEQQAERLRFVKG